MKRGSRLQRIEDRWAIYSPSAGGGGLLGKGCWTVWRQAFDAAVSSDLRIPVFRTRQMARNAVLSCCYDDARVVKVRITVQVLP